MKFNLTKIDQRASKILSFVVVVRQKMLAHPIPSPPKQKLYCIKYIYNTLLKRDITMRDDDDVKLGRPRTLDRARACAVYLPEHMIQMAELLGHGNISRGVRIALEFARSKGMGYNEI